MNRGVHVPVGQVGHSHVPLLCQIIDKWNELPATDKQRYRLQSAEQWDDGITRDEAAKLIPKLKARGKEGIELGHQV